MNRYEYLDELDRLLSSLPYSERREIMYDYEEHFKEGLNEGKTEEDIAASLDTPDKIAIQYVTALVPAPISVESPSSESSTKAQRSTPQKPFKKSGNGIGEIVALSIIMFLFNCIFIGFYLGFWGMLIGLVALGASSIIAGFAVLISAIVAAPIAFLTIPAAFFQYPILLFIGSVLLLSLGGLILIAMFYTVKFTYIATVKYVKWNFKLIRGF